MNCWDSEQKTVKNIFYRTSKNILLLTYNFLDGCEIEKQYPYFCITFYFVIKLFLYETKVLICTMYTAIHMLLTILISLKKFHISMSFV